MLTNSSKILALKGDYIPDSEDVSEFETLSGACLSAAFGSEIWKSEELAGYFAKIPGIFKSCISNLIADR